LEIVFHFRRIAEDAFSPVPARHDVTKSSGIFNANSTSHDPIQLSRLVCGVLYLVGRDVLLTTRPKVAKNYLRFQDRRPSLLAAMARGTAISGGDQLKSKNKTKDTVADDVDDASHWHRADLSSLKVTSPLLNFAITSESG